MPGHRPRVGKICHRANGSTRAAWCSAWSQGVRFRVEVSSFEETLDKASFASAGDYVQATALGKLTSVVERLQQQVRARVEDVVRPRLQLLAPSAQLAGLGLGRARLPARTAW